MSNNDEASAPPPPGTPPPKQGKKITVDIPKELKAVYANLAFISHTPSEIVLDFAQVLPRMPRGSVLSRVIMSPMHAKLLQMALTQNISNYERQFGQIQLPQQNTLAQQFFSFRQPGSGDDEPEQDE